MEVSIFLKNESISVQRRLTDGFFLEEGSHDIKKKVVQQYYTMDGPLVEEENNDELQLDVLPVSFQAFLEGSQILPRHYLQELEVAKIDANLRPQVNPPPLSFDECRKLIMADNYLEDEFKQQSSMESSLMKKIAPSQILGNYSNAKNETFCAAKENASESQLVQKFLEESYNNLLNMFGKESKEYSAPKYDARARRKVEKFLKDSHENLLNRSKGKRERNRRQRKSNKQKAVKNHKLHNSVTMN